jgi:dolichol-phosphate mannosyltransferase
LERTDIISRPLFMNIVVILPTFNERENIVLLLDQLEALKSAIKKHTISFLVADDTSPDGTKDAVEEYRKRHKDVLCITGKKEGLGKALLRGMTYAVEELHADVILQMDADLSHDPKKFPEFIKAIDTGADFAVGSRYIKGGSIPENWRLHRKIFSIAGNAIVRYGLGYPSVHDWTGGYRAYKKRFFLEAKDEMKAYSGYVFQIAFLHKAVKRGAKIVEIPFHFTDRLYGRSKIAPFEYIRNVLEYVIQARIKDILEGSFGKFAVVGTVGFIINTVILVGLKRIGLHPAIGSALGAECAIISNFFLNNAWTFKERKIVGVKKIGKFVQFNMTSVGAIIIQSGTVYIGTLLFGIPSYFVFYILGVGLGLIWNYSMYSRVIWKKS